ncbi:MAG: S-layer homology domain-containing protein [Oscillospiraceae bacterium]|nr:S-layer homology domain-containing protein [Oscillospiraceae bacterium]
MKINRLVSILLAVVMVFGMFAVTVSAEEAAFSDIKGHWAEEIINEWASHKVVNGYPDGTFKPDNYITRAEFAQVVKNLLALDKKADKDFSDVAKGAWYYDAVMCVAKAEIMVGHEGKFRPDDYITREEALLAYARLVIGVGEDEQPDDLSMFPDGGEVSDWAKDRISALVREGIILGSSDGKLHPKDNITRAELLAMLKQTQKADHNHYFVAEDGTCSVCHKSEEETLKFYVGVASGETKVEMKVYNDYSAYVTVPAKEVDASKVSVTVKMQNVATLGVTSAREHSIEIKDTGLTGTPNLADWLSNAFTFESGYVKATIDGEKCLYKITGDQNKELATLRAASDDIIATRDAWKTLTSYVTTSTQKESDSYVLIPYGSCLRIGTELLGFEKEDDLKLDNFNDIAALVNNIKEHVKLDTAEAGDWQIEAVLKAGTTLAVSNSVAVLDKDATIKVKGLSAESLATLLSSARDAKSNYELATLLVKAVNEVIGAVNGTTEEAPVEVEISFAAEK